MPWLLAFKYVLSRSFLYVNFILRHQNNIRRPCVWKPGSHFDESMIVLQKLYSTHGEFILEARCSSIAWYSQTCMGKTPLRPLIVSTYYRVSIENRSLRIHLKRIILIFINLCFLVTVVFLNFAKSCILLCLSQFDNKKWGSIGLFLSSEHLMPKLRLFVAGHIVAMVTCYIEKKDDHNLFTSD